MGSASYFLFLLMLISTSTFLFLKSIQLIAEEGNAGVENSFTISKFQYHRVIEEQIKKVSGEDNVGEGISVLTRFRLLLGLGISKSHRHKPISSSNKMHPFSPAPAPAEEALTPSPAPTFHTYIYTRSPIPRRSHHPPVHSIEDGRSNRAKNHHRRTIIAVVVSLGVTLVIFGVAILLVCKKNRRRTRPPSSATNKVSYDPGPELFYLNSLAPLVEIDSSLKLSSEFKNVFTNQSMSSSPSPSSHNGEPIQCESSSVSCLDEEILHVESLSSDDESFHSVCNSHSSVGLDSIKSEASISHQSPKCSPFNSSYESASPNCRLAQLSPIEPPTPPMLQDSTHSFPLNLKVPPSSHWQILECRTFQDPGSHQMKDNLDTEQSLQMEMTSLPSSSPSKSSETSALIAKSPSDSLSQRPSSITKQANSGAAMPSPLPSKSATMPSPQPSKSVISNNDGKPTQCSPLPPPVISNGNIPKPPPPPLPPSRPPSFQKGGSSVQPPPPPPCLLQQSTPVGKDGTPLPKLKPLHWDKVRAAPDHSMVWDKIRSSSFELDEQMIESLFGYNLQNSAKNEEAKNKTSSPSKHVLDNKRLQNITILLKALNATTEQVCDALMQGNGLCAQQLEALVKMAPTKEEEEKLSCYDSDINELGSAERFVKAILNIPFSFSRIEVMLYKETFEDEVVHLKKSFAMLEEACKELRSSRLFLRLLEAVLKTGNRMNVGTIRGGARAFKLDTLLKLSDVKGTDGKTTLLHFVVQEIIRSEGVRAMEKAIEKATHKNKPKTAEEREEDYRVMGLDLISGLSTELCNVKKTASIDLDVLASSVSNLSKGKGQLKHLVEVDLSIDERNGSFVLSMKSFLNHAERIIKELKDDEDRVLVHVREITEYYHGHVSKDEANPLRIFVIVRDFLAMLDRVCKEIRDSKNTQGPNHAIPFR